MKRPAFQFYPADWRKDMALQSCSVAARGLWIDILCIAHECEPYGHLTVNGRPMSAAQIGRHTGLTQRECERLLAELADAGVSSSTDEGVIFSRRMVRDEDLRNRRAEGGKAGSEHGAKGAEHGSKGGRPAKVRGVSEPPSEPPPSSSSSSSSSTSVGKPPTPAKRGDAGSHGFDAFWQAYPRKIAKPAALKAFAKLAPSAELLDEILQAIARQRTWPQWAKDGGQFIPHPATWLNGSRWQDEGQQGASVAPFETPRQRAARERVFEMTGGLVSARPPGQQTEFVDVIARPVASLG